MTQSARRMDDVTFRRLLDNVREANPLSSVAGTSLKLIRAGSEWKACCPFHADRSPSFTIFDGDRRFHCFGCGASGDVLDFVQRTANVDLHEAVRLLGACERPTCVVPVRGPTNDKAATVERARSIWREAAPVTGTPAEAYLRRRGIVIDVPPAFRFARLKHPDGGQHPCLVALVTSPSNEAVGVQRTYLDDEGRKAAVSTVKLSLGRVSGGAIRLAAAAPELIVTEGAEDGLTLLQELGRPVWIAAGASMLPSISIPACTRSIIIGADGDAAGEEAARRAAGVYAARGLAVRIMRPAAGFKDFNEQLTGGLQS